MTGNQIEDIRAYLSLSDSLATSGQPTAEQIAALRAGGYQVVINLGMPDSPHALAGEADIVAQTGMDYVPIPVVWDAPQPADLDQFFASMEQHAEKKRFVHCIANMRVSAFVYLYRVIKEGVPPTEAEASMHKIWQPNPVWAQFIDDALQRYGIERG